MKANDIDLGAIDLGQKYELNSFKSYKATFTPKKSGYLQVYSTSTTTLNPYKEMLASVTETVSNTDNAILTDLISVETGKGYEIPVEAGKVYNFCADFVMNKGEVSFAMNDRTMDVFSVSPAEGSTITPTKSCNISVSFVRMPKFEEATLIVNGEKQVLSGRLSTFTNSINFDVKTLLADMMQNGKCKEGDKMELTITGIKSTDGQLLYGSDGTYKVSFLIGKEPTLLVKQTHTSGTFMTYYEPGSDEAKVILEFNNNIKSAKAQLRYGDSDQQDNGGFYTEDLQDKLTIDGNKIIVDLSGKRRTVTDMVTSTVTERGEEIYKTITLAITNVVDVDGDKTYSTGSSTGKYYFTYDLDTPTANIGAEFSPESGSNIDDVDNIEIWIQDEEKLVYSGVDFTYYDDEVEKTITVSDFVKEKDEYADNAFILKVPVPAAVKGMGEITVALHNLTCVDGIDHSNLLSATYTSVATGISHIYAPTANKNVYYRLDGVRLGEHPNLKGVYILNGKKIVK